ncbi:hypothetical protein POM88_035002 [Heracleum sosnowskyi]|uniref:Uncharacterized protein n=1 Tax=Heracleum sosnowskyi TaxID=360622 RepID=A0AAD8MB45_9APIA|nr:hypothetical protein POM88_035002 [Heracleum sosnowskyi]
MPIRFPHCNRWPCFHLYLFVAFIPLRTSLCVRPGISLNITQVSWSLTSCFLANLIIPTVLFLDFVMAITLMMTLAAITGAHNRLITSQPVVVFPYRLASDLT